MIVDRPVPFPGTLTEARKNFRTHRWTAISEDESLCAECDCKPWHKAASYPCGTEPPRERVEFYK